MDMEVDDGVDKKKELKELQFSNYLPRSKDLKKQYKEPDAPESFLDKIGDEHERLINDTNRKFVDPSLDTDNLAPKGGTWDMKQELALKFQKLNEITQRAIKDIARKNQKSG